MENWSHAHANRFRYFGGARVIFVLDDLKTGVDHTKDWFMSQSSRTYREMAEYYNIIVIPV